MKFDLSNTLQGITGLFSKRINFFRWNGSSVSPAFTINLTSHTGLVRAYKICSPLATCVNRNSKALSNGKLWIVDKNDNDVSARYSNLTSLLKRPNPLQSWTEFMIQADTYRQLFGEVFIWSVTPSGFSDNKDAVAMWVINPQYIEIDSTKKIYMQSRIDDIVNGYTLTVDGEQTTLEKEHVLHIRDTFQNLDFGKLDVRGKSRVEGLEYPIKNIGQAYEALYSLNKDRGAQGILSPKKKDDSGSIPLTKKEKEELQKSFGEYGLSEGQKKVIVTDIETDWKTISFNVRDLMLFDGIKSNMEAICDTMEYPFDLLANGSGSSGSNLSNGHRNEAKKGHYQDVVIPTSQIYAEKLTDFFALGDHTLIFDFSHIECLKEAEKEAAETFKAKADGLDIVYKSGVISLEEYRLALGYDEQIYGGTMYASNESEGSTAEDANQ